MQSPACLGGCAGLVLPAGTGASTKEEEWDSVVLNSSSAGTASVVELKQSHSTSVAAESGWCLSLPRVRQKIGRI